MAKQIAEGQPRGRRLQIPLGMVLLSRLLLDRISRWANAIAVVVSIAAFLVPTLVTSTPDPDNWLFAAVEFTALLYIIGYAWTWRR